MDFSGFWGNNISVRAFFLHRTKRAAIERLVICVVELQPTRPRLVSGDPFDDHVYSNILSLLLAVDLLDVPHMEISPQKVGPWHRDSDEVSPIDGHPGPLFWSGLSTSLFDPSLKAD